MLFSAFACQQREAPRDVRLELPDVVTTSDPVKVLLRVTAKDGTTRVDNDPYPFAVRPETLASVSERGNLSCARSGDGFVTLTVGNAVGEAKLRCRLVARLDASGAASQVELADGAFSPNLRVLDQGGAELADVEVALTSKTPGVLSARGKQLVPNSVGSATLVARADQIAQEFRIDVVRKLKPEALPIDGNRRIHFSLEPGKYQLVVEFAQPRALKAEWRGAPHCLYSASERRHVSTCVLRTKGGVAFDNPAFLQSGATTVSVEGVSIHEVP